MQNLIDPDDDNDGMADVDEIIAGTSPTDSNDFFKISSIEYSRKSHAIISWNSVTGRTYKVFVTTNNVSLWPTGFVYHANGDGNLLSYTNGNNGKIKKYYKITVELSE